MSQISEGLFYKLEFEYTYTYTWVKDYGVVNVNG